MADLVVVPLPSGETLALDADAYHAALQRGRELMPAEPRSPPNNEGSDEVLDADGMSDRTGVPASWWLEAARRGDVPSIQAGKYRRFRLSACLEALEVARR